MKKRRGMTKKERRAKKKEQLKNKKLIKKYYWLMPRSAWTGKILSDYDYTWIEWGWCDGWDKTFGSMFMKELGNAIKKSGQKNFQIVEIKEKYGELRLYHNGCSKEANDIIDKYTRISQNICMWCGCEAPMIDDGWVSVMCLDCFKKYYRRREKYISREDYVPKTDEELTELYNKYIIDKPDENGEYHMAKSFTWRHFSTDGDWDETIDISETVEKIQKKLERRKKK